MVDPSSEGFPQPQGSRLPRGPTPHVWVLALVEHCDDNGDHILPALTLRWFGNGRGSWTARGSGAAVVLGRPAVPGRRGLASALLVSALVESALLGSAPSESAPLESLALESAPLESAPFRQDASTALEYPEALLAARDVRGHPNAAGMQ